MEVPNTIHLLINGKYGKINKKPDITHDRIGLIHDKIALMHDGTVCTHDTIG